MCIAIYSTSTSPPAYYALNVVVLIVSNYAMSGPAWPGSGALMGGRTVLGLLSIRTDITPGMTTVLRLPNMAIVLGPEEQANTRRSDRIRNLSEPSSQQQNSERPSRRGKRRLRYNSVMEEDIDDTEELESKRREPEHRRLNRLRLMKQNENVS